MNPDFLDDMIDALPYPIFSSLALLGSERGIDAGRARFEFMAEAGEAQVRFIESKAATADTAPWTGKEYAHPYYWAPFILMGNWL